MKKKDLPFLSGTAMKNHRLQLERAGLKDLLIFFQSIRTFFFMTANAYKLMKEDDNRMIYLIFSVRFMIDAIYSMYALMVVPNKLTYINKFINGEETNGIKINGKNLTSGLLGNIISERYEGLKELYKESCRYAHPSIFYKASKHLLQNTAGILAERKNKWQIKGSINNTLKMDYLINVLADILHDTQLEIHNEVLVPLYPDKLTPIEWKRRAKGLSKNDCLEYIKTKRAANN